MIPTGTAFKSTARVVVLLTAIGGAAFGTAAPALAQEGPSSSFSIVIPDYIQDEAPAAEQRQAQPQWGGGGYEDDYAYDDYYSCLTNRDVRRGIADYGFSRVEVTRELRDERVDVRAVYGNWLYTMRVDKCTGEVTRVRQAQRVYDDTYNGGFGNGGGFGFEFNFGG